MRFLSAEIRRVGASSLARNAGWMFLGQAMNLLLQAAYFILLARLLGVKEYGIFVGAFAFVSLASPYSALGAGLLFMRYVSADTRNLAAYWGNIVFATLTMGSLLTLLVWLVAPHVINPASASLVLLVALGECICRQFALCVAQVFQAFERLLITASVTLLTSFLRLAAVIVLALLLHRATAWQWALASLAASFLAAAAGAVLVLSYYGVPQVSPRLFASRFGEGFNFALAGSTQSIYNDIDKTMLSHYGMNVDNGIYTMAYRIVDVATIPISALDAAALPRYFRRSRQGSENVRNLSVRLALRAALLGLLAAACLFLAAPLIPRIVGNGFTESVLALRWLCLLPFFRGVHQLTGSAVTGLGFQRYRTNAQLFAALLNFLLNLWLIPRHGWLGAAWASLATDGGLAVVNWLVLHRLKAIPLEIEAA